MLTRAGNRQAEMHYRARVQSMCSRSSELGTYAWGHGPPHAATCSAATGIITVCKIKYAVITEWPGTLDRLIGGTNPCGDVAWHSTPGSLQDWQKLLSIVARLGNPDPTVLWVWKAKELDGGAVGWGVLFYHEKRLFANHSSDDDTMIIFRVSGLGVFGRGHTT
jgi:hypothetical protein